jgi:hypothetical protein
MAWTCLVKRWAFYLLNNNNNNLFYIAHISITRMLTTLGKKSSIQ